MKIKRRSGSIAIFFCLLVTALSLVLGSWLAAAQQRGTEADLARAMQDQLNVALAAFDRPLYDQYGLFGLSPPAVDQNVFQNCLPPGLFVASQLEFKDPLLDPSVLDAQIIRRMKARLPGAWLDLWQSRLALFSSNLAGLVPAGDYGASPVFSSGPLPAKAEAQGLGGLFADQWQDLAAATVRKASRKLFGQEFAEIESSLLDTAQSQYQAFTRERLAVPDSSPLVFFLGNMPDVFSPSSLSRAGDALDKIFSFTTSPAYEKLCLVEFALSHLTCRTPFTVSGSGTSYQLGPAGKRLIDCLDTRPNEIEQLLVGTSDPKTAAATVRFILVTTRSLLHLAAILTDEAKLAALQNTALAFAAGLAAMSGGSVVLDPQAVTYILLAGQAIWSGIKDTELLINGKGVRFWPGRGNLTFELWYQDYLRLLLYAVPRATLVERCAGLISHNISRPLFTKVALKADWAGSSYSLAAGYETP